MKNFLLWISLLLLIILLLLPPGLRLFGKNLYRDKKNKNLNTVTTLNCTKANETINLSYVNNKAYNFQYLIKGNWQTDENLSSQNNNDVLSDINEELKDENNVDNDEVSFVNVIRPYSVVMYDEIEDVTEFRISLNELSIIPSELLNYTDVLEKASVFYVNSGFSCTNQSY